MKYVFIIVPELASPTTTRIPLWCVSNFQIWIVTLERRRTHGKGRGGLWDWQYGSSHSDSHPHHRSQSIKATQNKSKGSVLCNPFAPQHPMSPRANPSITTPMWYRLKTTVSALDLIQDVLTSGKRCRPSCWCNRDGWSTPEGWKQ